MGQRVDETTAPSLFAFYKADTDNDNGTVDASLAGLYHS